MQGLCAEKKAIGPRKRFNCSTLQSIPDKEAANRCSSFVAEEERGVGPLSGS